MSENELTANETAVEPAEREGLPRSYRMRADRHYVDQLAAPAAGQPVRMVRISDIANDDPAPPVDVRPLVESIRNHGIVHPLLVRRRGSSFVLVAGRRRLAAAKTLRHSVVPCLVHDLDEVQAAALGDADNVIAPSSVPSAGEPATTLRIRQVIARHVATVQACTDIVDGGGEMSRAVFDLIRAHTWRASRLIAALDLIGHVAAPAGRARALSAVVDDVIAGFGPEARMNRLAIRGDVQDGLSSSGFNEHDLAAGIASALLAVVPIVEPAAPATITVRGSITNPGQLVLEVTQQDVPVSAVFARVFFDNDPSLLRPGGPAALAGALAANALGQRYEGSASFEPTGPGSTLRISLVRPS